MTRTINFVELTVYERLLPLVSGYLQSYACRDPDLRAAYAFRTFSAPVRTPLASIVTDLVKAEADIYAISCYVWNMGLVKQVLAALLEHRPTARIMLGGPQVIAHAHRYVQPTQDQVAVCNGEGERVFANYLRELLQPQADLARVNGLSFYRGGELVTTAPEPKMMDLDEIPSPFLNGVFEKDRYTYAIYETNRGCPYRCSFCYWGLGEARVAKFTEGRVYEELTWLSHNGFLGMFIADANWGMLKRDVDFTRHIVEVKKTTGLPYMVVISSAKNNADRLVEIAEIFQSASIMTTQSIAVQSLDDEALRRVERSNIKVDAYAKAQERMNELRLASYVELIWPLPGETLTTFMRGVERLCSIRAQSFIPYPLQLLNNTKLADRREEFGFVTMQEPAHVGGEAELVVATREVSFDDYKQGLWFCFAVLALYNARGLYCLSHYLARRGTIGYADLFAAFSRYCQARARHPIVDFYRQSVDDFSVCEAAHWGRVLHQCLHAHRAAFDALVYGFVAAQPWWAEDTEAVFEIDLLNKLYAYSNTPVAVDPARCRLVRAEAHGQQCIVTLRPADFERVRDLIEMLEPGAPVTTTFTVNYRRKQMPFMTAQSLDHNASYCHAVMENIRSFMPVWTASA